MYQFYIESHRHQTNQKYSIPLQLRTMANVGVNILNLVYTLCLLVGFVYGIDWNAPPTFMINDSKYTLTPTQIEQHTEDDNIRRVFKFGNEKNRKQRRHIP